MAKQLKVNLRLSDEADAACKTLQSVWAYSDRTEAIEHAASCWAWTLEHAAASVGRRFTGEEWSLVADVCNGREWPYGPHGGSPGPLLAQEVADGCHRGMHYRWLSGSDLPALALPPDARAGADERARDLIRRLAALEYVEAWAVVRAVCWFWQRNDVGTDVEWWRPEVRREHATKTAEGAGDE